jgi:hypothetical protein
MSRCIGLIIESVVGLQCRPVPSVTGAKDKREGKKRMYCRFVAGREDVVEEVKEFASLY